MKERRNKKENKRKDKVNICMYTNKQQLFYSATTQKLANFALRTMKERQQSGQGERKKKQTDIGITVIRISS